MYYYIMEPLGKKEAVWQEKVKNVLADLGIAGETAVPSPARSVEELTNLGVVKGYSTIVAVGTEKIINKVATAIINQKENPDTVLGIIPFDFEGKLAKKFQLTDLRTACTALKHRKLETIDLCVIEPNKYFLTQAEIENNHNLECYITTPEIKAGLPFSKIVIEPGLKISITDNGGKDLSGKKVINWLFGKKEEDITSSFFKTKKFKLEVPESNIPLKIDGEIVAKTPFVCHNRSKALKIIVARDIISTKE